MKVLTTLLVLGGVAVFANAAEFGIYHNNEDHNGLSQMISESLENDSVDKMFNHPKMEDKTEYNDETNTENLTNIQTADDIEMEYKYYKKRKRESTNRYNTESDRYNHIKNKYQVVKGEYDDANNELQNMRHYDRRYRDTTGFDFQNKMEDLYDLYDMYSYYSHRHENTLNDYLLAKDEYQNSVNKYNHAKVRYDDAMKDTRGKNPRNDIIGDLEIKDNKRDKRDGVDTLNYYKLMWGDDDDNDDNEDDDDNNDDDNVYDDDDDVKGKGNYLTVWGVVRDGNKMSLDGRHQDLRLTVEDIQESVQDLKEDKLGFASSLRQCRVNNNIALNSCLVQTMEDLRPHLRTGVPELSLPVLEPMFIPNLNFRQGNGAVHINAIFRNLEIRGLSSFNTTYIDADPHSQTLNVGLYIPELRITGSYDLDGLLLVLPIKGQGPFWTTFNGIHANGIGNIDIVTQAPVERLQVSNVYVNFDINRMRVKLDNLFGGDPVLGETVHHFLNENGKEVLAEIKPEIQRRLNELVQKVMNDAFSQLPVDAFLLRN